uniref:LCCL domain-containing protein n=1 Tax=Scleropages formosus TaxID=113540 RepID=A0A8C9SIR4_SCLFO
MCSAIPSCDAGQRCVLDALNAFSTYDGFCGTQPHRKLGTTCIMFPAIPAIGCDVRAGKINHMEFIARCPANCLETKQPVYGSRIFASISSICNAAIHG